MKIANLFYILKESVALRKQKATATSAVRFVFNQLLLRLNSGINSEQTLYFRNGHRIHYRRNRGDLQSIREVWLEHHYQLPEFVRNRKSLVDLGGNIGLTTLWLAKEYGFSDIVVVEPDSQNAAQLNANIKYNRVSAKVIQAAVGPCDGVVRFSNSDCSNQGRITDKGTEVPMVSMQTVLSRLEGQKADLVKLDIEGGEEYLVSANCDWMDSIDFVITELHPEIMDLEKVVQAFKRHGLVYRPGNAGVGRSKNSNFMDMFVRESAC